MSSTEVATWIQAVGSAGSLLAFAAWVGIAIVQRRDEFERHLAQQARQVAAWIDRGDQHGSSARYVVCIANGADTPVYRCRVVVPALEHNGDRDADVRRDLVPPRTTVVADAPGIAAFADALEGGAVPPMAFTDSAGRRWRRDGEGRLTEG